MVGDLRQLSLHMTALHLLPPRSLHDLGEVLQQLLAPGGGGHGVAVMAVIRV